MTSTVKTNSVARKRGTSARDRAATSKPARSSKLSAAKRAGGQSTCDTQGSDAASKVARKRGKAKMDVAPITVPPSHNSRASGARAHQAVDNQSLRGARTNAPRGASGQGLGDTHVAPATRKVGRKPRTAAFVPTATILVTPQSTNNPRAKRETPTKECLRAATHSDGHASAGTHVKCAVADSIPDVAATGASKTTARTPPRQEPQCTAAMPASQADTIIAIYGNWRRRQALVKAMTKLSLQAQATLRFGRDREEAAKHYAVVSKNPDHDDYIDIVPYLDAMQSLEKYRTNHEKSLVKLVKDLPIYDWAKAVSGLGDVSLAGLVGECSGLNVETNEWWSIGQMKSVSAMWKRLGLAVMGGVRQGDATAGLSKSDWVEHGYVKTRRSVVWNVGECVIKAQWRKENTVHAYGKFYGEEKARLQALNEAGEYAEQAARIVERMKKAGSKPLAENLAGRLTAGHINNRAKRHMTKRLIRDLFIEWRRLDREVMGLPPDGYAPVAEAA